MNNSSTVCIDANIVIQRVVSNAAENLWETWAQSGVKLVAPTLLFYEVTNGLYRYQKAGIFPPETVEKTLKAAIALPIELSQRRRFTSPSERFGCKIQSPCCV